MVEKGLEHPTKFVDARTTAHFKEKHNPRACSGRYLLGTATTDDEEEASAGVLASFEMGMVP
eukprot:6387903-Alexandrium_andersonii.AAC.1